jgi:phage major head subunit gpT-like protein
MLEVMFEWLKDHPEEYSQFTEVSTTDSAYDQDQIIAGLGQARLKLEGEPITYDDPIQGPTKRIISLTYALGWQVTAEMLQDEKYGVMKQIPGELMSSCRQTWEQVAAQPLNLGFTTMTTADGASFFNTTHPLLGGGTYSNRASTPADLSETSLQDMVMSFEYMVNERGLKKRLGVDKLFIPPDLQFTAAKLLQTPLQVGTGNNDINTMKGRFTPVVLHFLTDTNNWFASSSEHNKLKFKWRQKPVTGAQDDFETGGTKHKISFRIACEAMDWRGWWGSAP